MITYDIQELKEMFAWGSWTHDNFTWCGREVCTIAPDHLVVGQQGYIQGTTRGFVEPAQLATPMPLTPQQRTEFKSCVGSLQYVASNSRPDVASVTSLCQGTNITTLNLQQAYDAIDYLHDTSDVGIHIRGTNLERPLVVGYGDSSWANADGSRTQIGLVICITDESALTDDAIGSIADWKSGRTKRIVRSTLAGEAIACDATCDHAFFVAALLSEMLYNTRATTMKTNLPIKTYVCTDCKSLYDVMQKVNPSLDEKRTLVDVLSIRESLAAEGLRWIPTDQQKADSLTKVDDVLSHIMMLFMASTHVALRKRTN